MPWLYRDERLRKLYPGAKYIQNPHPLYNHFGSKINKNEACRKLGIHPSKKNLLFFGLIRDYKGLDLLIEAMGQLNEDYHLIIAGECYGSFEKYQTLIDASPAKKRIFVHCEYISDEEIPIYFSAADALVLPYRSATQSGVVSVAYNYDLPMLSTPVGDFKNSIEKPGTGIVVPEISATALAQGIEELFTPSQQATIPANISKEKAALSWETLTRKLLDFINSDLLFVILLYFIETGHTPSLQPTGIYISFCFLAFQTEYPTAPINNNKIINELKEVI